VQFRSLILCNFILLLTLGRMMLSTSEPTPLNILLVKGPAQFAFGYAFVYSGAKFAPRKQLGVLFGLAGLICVAGGAALFASLLVGGSWGLLEALATMAGAAAVVWKLRKSSVDTLPDY